MYVVYVKTSILIVERRGLLYILKLVCYKKGYVVHGETKKLVWANLTNRIKQQ